MPLTESWYARDARAWTCEEPDAGEERIREVLSGNICRCTGYLPIIHAVMDARSAYQSADRG